MTHFYQPSAIFNDSSIVFVKVIDHVSLNQNHLFNKPAASLTKSVAL